MAVEESVFQFFAFGLFGFSLAVGLILMIDWRIEKYIKRLQEKRAVQFQNAVIGLHKENLEELLDTEIDH